MRIWNPMTHSPSLEEVTYSCSRKLRALSLDISSVTPKRANSVWSAVINPWANAWTVPCVAWNISTQPVSRSPATKYWYLQYPKEYVNTDSNGVDSIGEGTGGRAACEGAFLLHVAQWSHVDWMSFVLPGQNTIVQARESMAETHWRAEWSIYKTCSRRDRITTLSPKSITSSATWSDSRNGQNAARASLVVPWVSW